MKVLIADDEDKVCQLIYKLVDWQQLGMEVVSIVHNGIEALEAIQKYNPNVIITDIRMPGYDGLEMIRRAKEISENMDFIIISGYRHFEYAQNAIKYGVKDYLLKPIKKAEIVDTLSRMREEYLERTRKLTSEEEYRISIKNNLDRLRHIFFTDILFKRVSVQARLDVESVNEKYHYTFSPGIFQVVLIKIDGVDTGLKSNSEYIHDKVVQLINKKIDEYCFDIESIFENNLCYIILNYSEENKKAVRRSLKALLDELLLQKDIIEDLKITIGTGVPRNSICEMFSSMKTAMWAIEQRLVLGVNKVIEGAEVSSNELADSTLFAEFNKRLVEALERIDENQVRGAFNYLEESLKRKESSTGHEVIQMAKEAMNLYLFTLRKNKFVIRDSDVFFDSFSMNIENCSSIEEVFDFLSKTIIKSFNQVVVDKKQEDIKPIRDAKQYIKDHYKEPISLEIVSDYVGFNAAYFSSLFKKETNTTFSEYLTGVRMERAKELLKESNLNVATICEEVGYNDIKNFTKGFAKYTNLKPNEYRKIYS